MEKNPIFYVKNDLSSNYLTSAQKVANKGRYLESPGLYRENFFNFSPSTNSSNKLEGEVSSLTPLPGRKFIVRQNNIAAGKVSSNVSDIKLKPITLYVKKEKKKAGMYNYTNSNGKIKQTDFWSDNMKREVVKMGRIDAFEGFSGKMTIDKAPVEKEITSSLTDVLKNKILSRKSSHSPHAKPEKKKLIKGKSFDMLNMLKFCNDSIIENSKLRNNMHKTTTALRTVYNKIIENAKKV